VTARNDVIQAFEEARVEFPFPGYMENKLTKYNAIVSEIMEHFSQAKVLSIGSGPCDLEAILSKLGYDITAIDDLKDHWHLIGNNRERIKDFAWRMDIKLIVESAGIPQWEANYFDIVLLIDIIEHLHTSPRELLNFSISALKPGGLLLIETPNCAALAKRIEVVFGKSNQVNANFFYWNVGEYRSHVREYTKSELKQILHHHKLNILNLRMLNLLDDTEPKGILNKIVVRVYKFVSGLYPNFRSTMLIVGKKPTNWQTTDPSIKNLSKYYPHIERWNLDNVPDDVLLNKILEEHSRGLKDG